MIFIRAKFLRKRGVIRLGSSVLLYSSLGFFKKGIETTLKENGNLKCVCFDCHSNDDLESKLKKNVFSVAVLHFLDYSEFLRFNSFFESLTKPAIVLVRGSSGPIAEKVYEYENVIVLSECVSEEELVKLVKFVINQNKVDPLVIEKRFPEMASKIIKAEKLSQREIEILYLLARGMTSYSISLALDLSVHTVRNHIARIYAKLNVSDRVSAVMKALETGLLKDYLKDL